jgi:hypothetical protein
MKLQTAIARIHKAKPVTPSDFAGAGVPLEKAAIGTGAFREVVKVEGCPLVVKFPLDCGSYSQDGLAGIAHSALEMKKLKRLRRFRWMRKFLPKVYYYDRKHGIIVMRHYELMTKSNFLFDAKLVYALIKHSTGVNISDYTWGNAGISNRGFPILLDCGY